MYVYVWYVCVILVRICSDFYEPNDDGDDSDDSDVDDERHKAIRIII